MRTLAWETAEAKFLGVILGTGAGGDPALGGFVLLEDAS